MSFLEVYEMSANNIIFAHAEMTRDALMKMQTKEITSMYDKWAADVASKANKYSRNENISSKIKIKQLKELEKSLNKTSGEISMNLERMVNRNAMLVSDAVVQCNKSWLKELGFPISGVTAKFSNVPFDVVSALQTGTLYKGGWTLSKAIWGDNKQTMRDIYNILAGGIAENKSAYDIAKSVERYVSPSKAMKWNKPVKTTSSKPFAGAKYNPETGKYEAYQRIYKKQVDYNAQRLARTIVQHSYQRSFVECTKDNPFILTYIWVAEGRNPCELCEERDGQHFKKDELPLDHPNGQCTIDVDIDPDYVDKLADWVLSPDGTFPEIDEYAEKLGYNLRVKALKGNIGTSEEYAKTLGSSTAKTFKGWYKKLDEESKEIVKALKEKEGLTWQKWYEKYIQTGKAIKEEVKSEVTAIKGKVELDKSNWMNIIKGQKESTMLAKEAVNFSKMTELEIQGLGNYTGSGFRKMNGYLRNLAQGYSKSQAKSYADIDSSLMGNLKNAMNGLNKTMLGDVTVLRRGTDLGDLAGIMPGNFNENLSLLRDIYQSKGVGELDKIFSGAKGTYAGFTSTSSLWERGFSGSVEMIFYAPEGTPGSSIMNISRYGTSEGETLLPPGTTIKIHQIEESDGHFISRIRVWCEILTK